MSMLRKATLRMSAGVDPEKLTDGQKASLSACIIWPSDGHYAANGEFHWWTPYLVDVTKIPFFVDATIEGGGISPVLEELAARATTVINQKVNVAVPNFGMMQMTRVAVLEDCCTDRLQGELDNGWRILAICPQPDQRRPDYVLGRAGAPE